jgi:hypothetical protein
MKTIDLHENGVVISESVPGIDSDGNEIQIMTRHEIHASQLFAHLPMFESDLTPEQLEQVTEIIVAHEK